MKDRETSKPRGFGFISFDTEEAVENVIAKVKEHKLLDKWVECKKATQRTNPPKPTNSAQPRHKAPPVLHLLLNIQQNPYSYGNPREMGQPPYFQNSQNYNGYSPYQAGGYPANPYAEEQPMYPYMQQPPYYQAPGMQNQYPGNDFNYIFL